MAVRALRTLSVAYKEVKNEAILQEKDDKGWPAAEQGDLILITIFGIQDPVRAEVPDAVLKCQEAGIKVRMVTGDNKITARAIAKECHILMDHGHNENVKRIMEGAEFRQICGGVICLNCQIEQCDCARSKRTAKQGQKVREDVIKNFEAFQKIIDNLDVLARSQPQDKYLLVTGLQQMNCVVAVTGDGTNDAPALEKADIGFAMGEAGTEVAKQAADIILLDDNFSSIVQATKWGRNIYDNIRRFIQFQLTVNIVAVISAIIGAFTIKESPLTAVQLLWVNLIMDTFASLALATQAPNDKLLSKPPHVKGEKMVNKVRFNLQRMWKHILGQAIYQCFVVFTILYLGEYFIPENSDEDDMYFDSDPSTQRIRSGRLKKFNGEDDYEKYYDDLGPSRHLTVVFNTFVLMQLFNEINARKIEDEINILEGLTKSKMYLGIWFLTFSIQIIMVEFGGWAINCALDGLNWDQWLLCIAFGAFGLIWGAILRLIPMKTHEQKLPALIKDNAEHSQNSSKTMGLERQVSSRKFSNKTYLNRLALNN